MRQNLLQQQQLELSDLSRGIVRLNLIEQELIKEPKSFLPNPNNRIKQAKKVGIVFEGED